MDLSEPSTESRVARRRRRRRRLEATRLTSGGATSHLEVGRGLGRKVQRVAVRRRLGVDAIDLELACGGASERDGTHTPHSPSAPGGHHPTANTRHHPPPPLTGPLGGHTGRACRRSTRSTPHVSLGPRMKSLSLKMERTARQCATRSIELDTHTHSIELKMDLEIRRCDTHTHTHKHRTRRRHVTSTTVL